MNVTVPTGIEYVPENISRGIQIPFYKGKNLVVWTPTNYTGYPSHKLQ